MDTLLKKINYLEFTLEHPDKKKSKIIILGDLVKLESTSFARGRTISGDFQKIDFEKMQELLFSLNKITFDKWKKNYTAYNISQPVVWQLYLQYNDNKRVKEYFGMNEYPISTKAISPFHPRSSTSYTPEFKILLSGFNKFLGKTNFFI